MASEETITKPSIASSASIDTSSSNTTGNGALKSNPFSLSLSSLSSSPSPTNLNPGAPTRSPLSQSSVVNPTSFTRSSFIIPSSSFSPAPSSNSGPSSYLLHHFPPSFEPNPSAPIVDTEIGEMGGYGLAVSVLVSRFDVTFKGSVPPPPAELSAPVELATLLQAASSSSHNNANKGSSATPSPARGGKKKVRRKARNQKTWDHYEREKEKQKEQQNRSLKEILERKDISRKNRLTRSNSLDHLDPRISQRIDPGMIAENVSNKATSSSQPLFAEDEMDSGSESDDEGRCFMFKGMRVSIQGLDELNEEERLLNSNLVTVSRNHRLFRDDYYGDFGATSTSSTTLNTPSRVTATNILPVSGSPSPGRPLQNESFPETRLHHAGTTAGTSSPMTEVLHSGLTSSPAALERSILRNRTEEERTFLRKKEEMRQRMIEEVRRLNDLSTTKMAISTQSTQSNLPQQTEKVLTVAFMRKKKQTAKYRHLLVHVAPFLGSSFKRSHWANLSIEVQLRILKRLDITSLIFLTRTCKYFNGLISKCDQLWFLVCRRYFFRCPRSPRMISYDELQSQWIQRYFLCVKQHLTDEKTTTTTTTTSSSSSSPASSSTVSVPMQRLTPCSCNFYLEQKARHLDKLQAAGFSSSSSSSSQTTTSTSTTTTTTITLPLIGSLSSSSPQLRVIADSSTNSSGDSSYGVDFLSGLVVDPRETKSLNSIRDSVMEDSILFPATNRLSYTSSDSDVESKWKKGFLPRKWVSFREG